MAVGSREGTNGGARPAGRARRNGAGASDREVTRLAKEYRLNRQAIRQWHESMWGLEARLRVSDTRRLLSLRDKLFDRQRRLRIRLANLGRNDVWQEIDAVDGNGR